MRPQRFGHLRPIRNVRDGSVSPPTATERCAAEGTGLHPKKLCIARATGGAANALYCRMSRNDLVIGSKPHDRDPAGWTAGPASHVMAKAEQPRAPMPFPDERRAAE